MKDGFKSIEEILEEVGAEEGMSIEEMRDIWEHQKTYTKKRMEEEGVYAIFLPFIGTLSLNVKQFKKQLKGKTRSLHENFIRKTKSLLEDENFGQYNNSHKKITGVNRLARYIIKSYHTGIDKSKRLLVHTKCWDIIEKYSNGAFEKREETIKRTKNKND